jgi:hypothetical protein
MSASAHTKLIATDTDETFRVILVWRHLATAFPLHEHHAIRHIRLDIAVELRRRQTGIMSGSFRSVVNIKRLVIVRAHRGRSIERFGSESKSHGRLDDYYFVEHVRTVGILRRLIILISPLDKAKERK